MTGSLRERQKMLIRNRGGLGRLLVVVSGYADARTVFECVRAELSSATHIRRLMEARPSTRTGADDTG